MRISVFGLGYVGCVSSACLADSEHRVIGVDVDENKVDPIQAGRAPIMETGLSELVKRGVERGHLSATTSVEEAVQLTEMSLICVGTPSRENGSLDLSFVERVSAEIGSALKQKSSYHVVVFRSTMLPGSVEGRMIPILESQSGKTARVEFGVAYYPEFLREGSAIFDFYHPPKTVLGELDKLSGDKIVRLCVDTDGPVVRTNIKAAEMIKYVDNSFHALKVTFANEIGNVCSRMGVDSHEVMDIFCLDTKLNLSPYYLKPGFAFGGSCLPKDLRALIYNARSHDLHLPLIESILQSNEVQKRTALSLIMRTGKKKIGILGLSFKAGTDDLRESPIVELVERLIGKGYDISIYDKNVSLASIFGSNKRYIEHEIPHISSLMRPNLHDVLEHADVLVVSNRDPEFYEITGQLREGQTVVDLVRIPNHVDSKGEYVGICW